MGNEDDTGVAVRDGHAPAVVAAGWWPSPWSAAEVAAGKVSRAGLQVDRGRIFWSESRPAEGGRQVVVAVDVGEDGSVRRTDVSPPGVSVRSRVHEYGGGAATVADGVLYYVDQDDQDWYRVEIGTPGGTPAEPVRLTTTGPAPVRHTDGRTVAGGRWLVSVEERVEGSAAVHRLVAVATDGSGVGVALVDHGHFVAAPRPSPDGRWLAWCTWDHPDMPWDAARLVVAPLSEGPDGPSLGPGTDVAGGHGVSAGQPRWAADGGLVFVDDRTGWWLPYRVAPATFARPLGGTVPTQSLLDPSTAEEFHGPDWVFGLHTFDGCPDGTLVARAGGGGRDSLTVLHPPPDGPDTGPWVRTGVDQPCVSLAGVVCAGAGSVAVLGTTPTEAQAVFAVALDGSSPARRLSAAPAVETATERASHSVTRAAVVGDHRVPGLFFPPTNPDVPAGADELPPLVVFCHGGPTAAAEPGYDPTVQFLTSRGIAVAAVDYRGSTGYGRAYRDLLRGSWGEGDVDDCVAFAQALADDGLVDGARLAIRGGSAGGLTALAALIRARVFAGAVAWYGVTDLDALARDTHDFESRYLDGLVGPLPGAADVYRDRSPIHHAAALVGGVLLLQGADDPIVPLDQAERFAERLRAGGADVELIVFDGESHGFRRATTVEAALEAELAFYRRLFAGPRDPRA